MSAMEEQTARWMNRLTAPVSAWLAQENRPLGMPRNDFSRLREHLQPADVVLVEGRSRVSGVIQSVTLSAWTHAALYIGRASEISHATARERIVQAGWTDDTHLLVEAEIGTGVHLVPLGRYEGEHLRLCRPHELAPEDRDAVIGYALDRMDTPYDLRQIADLLRFFFPYGLLPRRWRSTLFEAGHGDLVRVICSTLLANAFASVRYPILPTLHRGDQGQVVFHRRNSRLVAPRDFDHSPYFDIVKYPFFGDDVSRYRDLEWDNDEDHDVAVSQPSHARP